MQAQLSLMPLIQIFTLQPYQLPGMLCIKRKQETILCCSLVSEDMARCIVQFHYITGCDANSSFYGKGKSLTYDKVTWSVAPQQTCWSVEIVWILMRIL